MKVIIAISVLLIVLAFIFSTMALLTPNWIERYQDNELTFNFGYFVECDHSVCSNNADFLLEKSGIRASFAFLILSVVLFLTSLGMLVLVVVKRSEVLYIPTGVCSIVASCCAFVGAAIYTVMSIRDINRLDLFHYGYSFALAWSAGAAGVIGGVLALVLRCTKSVSKDVSNSDCVT